MKVPNLHHNHKLGSNDRLTANHESAAENLNGLHATIEPESSDEIQVGAGSMLIVPQEDIDDLLDESSELDLDGNLKNLIRRPHRREWFVLNPQSEFTTRLLLHKPTTGGIEVDHYYVDKKLRGPITDELKVVRVIQYFSLSANSHGLWIINVTPDNSWYESLAALLKQPADFFSSNMIRVISNKSKSRYQVKYKPLTTAVQWSEKQATQLLGEALGPQGFITSAEHPVYRDLVDGTELM